MGSEWFVLSTNGFTSSLDFCCFFAHQFAHFGTNHRLLALSLSLCHWLPLALHDSRKRNPQRSFKCNRTKAGPPSLPLCMSSVCLRWTAVKWFALDSLNCRSRFLSRLKVSSFLNCSIKSFVYHIHQYHHARHNFWTTKRREEMLCGTTLFIGPCSA